MKFKRFFLPVALTLVAATSCNAFVFIGQGDMRVTNTLFFALYNYYGQDGQHFTHRWLGMKQALEEHGIKITNDAYETDAKKFKIDMSKSDLPEDTKIFMVNNRTWDPSLQFTIPLNDMHPLAVISTCNGVEFASTQILANSPGTRNATMGSFSKNYKIAMQEDSLDYMAAKYTCHIAPIFAAGINQVLAEWKEPGYKSLRMPLKDEDPYFYPDGLALQLAVKHWEVVGIENYEKMSAIDIFKDTGSNGGPTIKKSDLDPFFTPGSAQYDAQAITDWCANSNFEDIEAIFNANRGTKTTPRAGKKVKVGIIKPGTTNEVVQGYIDYCRGYLGPAYNVTFLADQAVTGTNNQKEAAEALINQDADFIISFQDDPDRMQAITLCNDKHVYFANAGTAQNNKDYEETKGLKYFVGSIGSTIEEEQRATYEMTKHYIDIIIDRGPVGKGGKELGK